jgi:type II secretory pathway pseudopilin PulG
MSLVELMVAMILLAIALAWLAPQLIIAMRGSRFGGDMTQAVTLAMDKMEEFRGTSYTALLASPTGQDTVNNVARSWSITEEAAQSGLARIVIDLSWQDDRGKDHQVQFVTMQTRAQQVMPQQ